MECKECISKTKLYGDKEILRGICDNCNYYKKSKKEKKITIIRHNKQKLRKYYNWYEFPNISDDLKNKILTYIQQQEFNKWGFRKKKHDYFFPGFTDSETSVRLSCKNNGRTVFIKILLYQGTSFACLNFQSRNVYITKKYHWVPWSDYYFSRLEPWDNSYIDDSDASEFDFTRQITINLEENEDFLKLKEECQNYVDKKFKVPHVK